MVKLGHNESIVGMADGAGANPIYRAIGAATADKIFEYIDQNSNAISSGTFDGSTVQLGSAAFGGSSVAGNATHTGLFGETFKLQFGTELLTLSTGGLTTDTTANLLPANSLILAVMGRVTTTITTATAWGLGDPTSANRFSAADTTLTAGETVVGITQWSGAITTLALGPSQAAAAKVRVTATVSNPGAGVVRICVVSLVFTGPTS